MSYPKLSLYITMLMLLVYRNCRKLTFLMAASMTNWFNISVTSILLSLADTSPINVWIGNLLSRKLNGFLKHSACHAFHSFLTVWFRNGWITLKTRKLKDILLCQGMNYPKMVPKLPGNESSVNGGQSTREWITRKWCPNYQGMNYP